MILETLVLAQHLLLEGLFAQWVFGLLLLLLHLLLDLVTNPVQQFFLSVLGFLQFVQGDGCVQLRLSIGLGRLKWRRLLDIVNHLAVGDGELVLELLAQFVHIFLVLGHF